MTQNLVRIEKVISENLDNIPAKALDYLQQASISLYSYLEIPHAIIEAKSGTGHIYQIYIDDDLSGCLFLNFRHVSVGFTMNVVLLGGDNMELWGFALSKFLNDLAEKMKVDEFTALGRKGFGKFFPELEHFACLYRKRLTGICAHTQKPL